jgi:putative inorganic carbon (HCO3(-)) transporter
LDKEKLLKYTDTAILVFLSLHVISSQWSVAASSIGLGGMIILAGFRLLIDRNIFKPGRKLFYLFGALIFVYMIASVFSIDPASSFSNSRRVFLFAGFFVTIVFISNLKQLKIILTVFFLFTAFISIIELVRYFTDYFTNHSKPIYELRIEYYGYPITNGEIKMLILLLLTVLILTKETFVLNKLWLILISIPVFFSLYFTNSRNAVLGLFVGLIIIGSLKNKYFLAALIIIVILFLVLAPLPIKERVLSIVDFNHPSIKSRFIMWDIGLKIIRDYPVLGIGDTDIIKVYTNYKPIQFHGEGSHLHNNYFQVAATIGITGLIVWLVLMIYLFVRQIKIYLRTRGNLILNSLALVSIVSMVAFQVSGLTEWNFGDFEFAAVLWFMLGLAFLSEKLYNKSAHENAKA